MAQFPPEITERFLGTPEQNATAMVGERPAAWSRPVVLVDYDPAWPDRFAAERSRIQEALGDRVIEHVGSTSVPGLCAKPVIDIDLLLPGTDDESAYVPALERAGYRLLLREPWWYGHRMLITEAADVHLHVWPEDAAEPVRHRLFRDWLREYRTDRDLYAHVKREVAARVDDDYTMGKNDVIDRIFGNLFLAAALRDWGAEGAVLKGPFEVHGMDPTWMVELDRPGVQGNVAIFEGPIADFQILHRDVIHVGGGEVTIDRLIEMLNEVAAVHGGAPLPSWLRPTG